MGDRTAIFSKPFHLGIYPNFNSTYYQSNLIYASTYERNSSEDMLCPRSVHALCV